MNKFLSLISVCFILVVADAARNYGSVKIGKIENIDGEEVKGDLRLTLKNSKSGEEHVVLLDDQILKAGETLRADPFESEFDATEADSLTWSWNLSESDAAKYAKKTPTVELRSIMFAAGKDSYQSFATPQGEKASAAPGEIIKMKKFVE